MRYATHYFNRATAIAAARLIPLPRAQSSSRARTAGSIVTVITLFFPVRLIAFAARECRHQGALSITIHGENITAATCRR